MTAPSANAIEVRGVNKRFGDRVIYRGLDLSVARGETLTVLGPSGSGKSVLLKLIIGLLSPESGGILVDGTDVVGLDERALRPIRDKVGILFQGAALFDSLSVGENVAYGLVERAAGTRAEVRDRVAECLGWVGLPGIEAQSPAQLSGGMKKRVGLARALATGPQMILYDEPTTGLDPANARRINELIVSLQERLKVTSLVITHDLAGAFAVSDRVALIDKGVIALVMDAGEAERSPPPLLERFVQGEPPREDAHEQ